MIIDNETSLKEIILDFLDTKKEYKLYARFSLVPEQELETEEAKKALLFESVEAIIGWLDKNSY